MNPSVVQIGLAEQSPHMPLKVLHAELEHPEVAFVGISNWALDPAKINRGIFLTRPDPGARDLSLTARGIAQSHEVAAYLKSLARAYHEIYRGQEGREFFGLRDFYGLVKDLDRECMKAGAFSPEILLGCIMHNFGVLSSQKTIPLIFFCCPIIGVLVALLFCCCLLNFCTRCRWQA